MLIERLLCATDGPTLTMGRGYANGWTARIGVASSLDRVRDEHVWFDAARGRMLLSHEPTNEIFDVVDGLDREGQTTFWSAVQPFWFKDDAVERGLRGVLEHGRADAFVDAAAMHVRKHPSKIHFVVWSKKSVKPANLALSVSFLN